MFTKPELDPLLINCQYTGEMEKWPLNFSHYVTQYSLTLPIRETENVERYVSQENPYPEGMIKDNLSCHLQRGFKCLTNILEIVDEKEVDKNLARLMFLLHDLGELRALSDVSVIDKKDTTRVEREHFLKVITNSFASKENIALKIDAYDKYTEASAFLKGDDKPPKKIDVKFITGLLVRTVDSIDGNLYFHKNLREWIEKGNKFPENHPSIPHMFKQREKYLAQIEELPEFKTKSLLIFLINHQIEYTRRIWKGSKYKMPNSLYKCLYGEPKPIPLFQATTVNIEDYEEIDPDEDILFKKLFDKVIYYFSLDKGLQHTSKYSILANDARNSFILTTNSNNISANNLLIKTKSSMSENELNLIHQHRDTIVKHGCIRTPTYGKLERQYFSLTEEGEPCTFGIASIKNNK